MSFRSKEPTISKQPIDYGLGNQPDIEDRSSITKREAEELGKTETAHYAQLGARAAKALAICFLPVPELRYGRFIHAPMRQHGRDR
jgi:hypothetical protein